MNILHLHNDIKSSISLWKSVWEMLPMRYEWDTALGWNEISLIEDIGLYKVVIVQSHKNEDCINNYFESIKDNVIIAGGRGNIHGFNRVSLSNIAEGIVNLIKSK